MNKGRPAVEVSGLYFIQVCIIQGSIIKQGKTDKIRRSMIKVQFTGFMPCNCEQQGRKTSNSNGL